MPSTPLSPLESTISSDDINYLVYRYLLECGFTHSTFAFQHESALANASFGDVSAVKPGALITLLQKGLKYLEVEAHLNEDGSETNCRANFSLITSHVCDVVEEDEEDMDSDSKVKEEEELETVKNTKRLKRDDSAKKKREKERKEAPKREPARKETEEAPKAAEPVKREPAEPSSAVTESSINAAGEEMVVDIVEASPVSAASEAEIDARNVIQLKGHEAEVFSCAWSPKTNSEMLVLASGSGDGTARIWKFSSSDAGKTISDSLELVHGSKSSEGEDTQRDVTTLKWNSTGTLLATGSYDGRVRIWNESGENVFTLSKHAGPIFSLRWNSVGDVLLTGSTDASVVAWDASTGEVRQQFAFHSASILDLDWKDDVTFATSSSDKQIFVCQLGSPEPLCVFEGHKSEVNIVKWSPDGKYLASCSDDTTCRVWNVEKEEEYAVFSDHKRELYYLEWCPSTTSKSGEPSLLLATASFDNTVRIWDVLQKTCKYIFSAHEAPVYSLGFSPSGQYLVSGSFDHWAYIWNVSDGQLEKKYKGPGGIFQVDWSPAGNEIAVCFSTGLVAALNVELN